MFVNNEDRIVKSLETIAECMVKSNEMAKEALKKSNRLYGANMAMMREKQKEDQSYKHILEKELLKFKDEPIALSEEQLKDLDGT